MKTCLTTLLSVLLSSAATTAFAQTPDPSACQYGGPNFTNPPSVSSCLATIPSGSRYIYGMARNRSIYPYSLVVFTPGGSGVPYGKTPSFSYHNASQNNTPYQIFTGGGGGYAEASGGGHDFGAMYTFNPITALTPNFNLDVKVGFTVMIMSWIDAGEAVTAYPKDYVTLFDQNNNALYTMGRLGVLWGLNTRASANSSNAGGAWQFPWDGAGATGFFQLAFYTFSPDGKVQIHVFHDESHDNPDVHDFESATIDYGSAMNPIQAGTPTSNPTSLNLVPVTSSTIGLGVAQRYDVPGTAFQEVDFWTVPLSRGQVAAVAAQRINNSGNFFPNSCNTGYMLNAAPPGGAAPGAVPPNVCGWSSNWSRTSTAAAGGAVQVSTTDLEFSTQASPQPYESADQSITVTNSGAGALSISAVTLAGDDPSDFSVDADSCSGQTLAPGATCTLQVGYTDYDQRADATLQLETNATTPAPVISLGGRNG